MIVVRLRDIVLAGAVGGVVGSVPSTLHSLVSRRPLLEPAMAAGTLLFPRERRPIVLLSAAVPVHAVISVGWAGALAMALPPRRTVAVAGAAGLAIAALDLGLVGRRHPRIRALPGVPQIADHVAYALAVGWVLRQRAR